MLLFWPIILGAVQGITEFFPISSSAHLSLFPYIFSFQDPGLAFDIALHAGTLLAIVLALWSDWMKLAKGVLTRGINFEKKLVGFLLLTSIPGALAGFFLEEKAATIFRNPLLSAAMLVVFGSILFLVDRFVTKSEKVESMNARNALIIGLSQAIAIIPGVSRSGATLTAGRALGLSREAAVKYSFMAALPIIAGATVFGLRDVAFETLASPAWLFGFLASLLSSFWAIRFLTKYVQKHDFSIFLYYRIALALLVVALYLGRN